MRVTKGSLWIEILLWCALIVPGLVYALWRMRTRYEACPACGSKDMIPLGTPAARLLVGRAEASDDASDEA